MGVSFFWRNSTCTQKCIGLRFCKQPCESLQKHLFVHCNHFSCSILDARFYNARFSANEYVCFFRRLIWLIQKLPIVQNLILWSRSAYIPFNFALYSQWNLKIDSMVSQQNRGRQSLKWTTDCVMWFVFCQTHKCSVVVYCQFSSSYDRWLWLALKVTA